MSRFEGWAAAAAAKVGVTVSRTSSLQNRLPIEATNEDRLTIDFVRPYTMTSTERVWALLRAVDYVVGQPVQGDFVECGVWRGGSVMAMARQLLKAGVTDRDIWMYDTFEGMTPPTDEDIEAVSGTPAAAMLANTDIGDGNNVWCVASEEDVSRNVSLTGYPRERLHFVRGDVAATLTTESPERISLLRLDTDWYESTKVSLETLYPRLSIGGVCILDDYGHWQGARKAVDDYFASFGARPLMMPVDFSGRLFIKTR